MIRRPPSSPLFPSTTLFRSGRRLGRGFSRPAPVGRTESGGRLAAGRVGATPTSRRGVARASRRLGRLLRSEEHTSELQSRSDLVCRLLLEKKKNKIKTIEQLLDFSGLSTYSRQ